MFTNDCFLESFNEHTGLVQHSLMLASLHHRSNTCPNPMKSRSVDFHEFARYFVGGCWITVTLQSNTFFLLAVIVLPPPSFNQSFAHDDIVTVQLMTCVALWSNLVDLSFDAPSLLCTCCFISSKVLPKGNRVRRDCL